MKMRNSFIVLSMAIGATLSMPAPGQVSFGVVAPRRQHRHQPAGLSGARPGAGLPGLLRPAGWTRTSSSTTACTGSTRATTGTRAPGTTAPGRSVAPDAVPLFVLRVPVRYYRQPPVYFRGWQCRCAAALGRALGQGMGTAATAAGTAGIELRCPRPPRCRSTSGNTRATDIRSLNSRSRSRSRIIATNRATPLFGSIIKRKRRKRRVRPRPACRLRSPRLRHAVSRSR